ncbi:MAG TPA: hypothetical protein VHO25_22105 [Polyangiaceae bacterium]|nr:hypothetical protein [Polyangiaceae bacterium]
MSLTTLVLLGVLLVVAAACVAWIIVQRRPKDTAAPVELAQKSGGDAVSMVAPPAEPLDMPAKPVKAAPPPKGPPRCTICRKPATKPRPRSSVPWIDTLGWLNQKARLNSFPRRYKVERPDPRFHALEFCDACEQLGVAYLEHGHAERRMENQRHLQTQDRATEALNAGMDRALLIEEEQKLLRVEQLYPEQELIRKPRQDSSPQLVSPDASGAAAGEGAG